MYPATAATLIALLACTPAACTSRPSFEDRLAAVAAVNECSPTPPCAREPWTFNEDPGLIAITPHYRLHTTLAKPEDRDVGRVGELAVFLEASLANYLSSTGAALPEPPRPLDTFLFRTRGQWERFTRQTLAEASPPFLAIRRGGYAWAGRVVMYDLAGGTTMGTASRDTLSLLAHEGWHQYTQSTLRQSLPAWLEEGLAALMEGHHRGSPAAAEAGGQPSLRFSPWANPERFDELRRVITARKLRPLSALLTHSTTTDAPLDDALGYYAQVWAAALFLREHHAQALARLLTHAAEGGMSGHILSALGPDRAAAIVPASWGQAVFEAYFSRDLDRADADYQAFIAALARPGAREHIVAGRSPFAVAGSAPVTPQ